MKKILSLVMSMAILMLSVLIPVSAETTLTPSAENTQFLYDKIVLDNSKETNYSIKTEEAGDVAFDLSDYKKDLIVENGQFVGLTGWNSKYCPTTGNVAELNQNYHLTQTVTLEKNTDYELRFDLDNSAVNTDSKPGWLQLNLKGADETSLVSVNTDSYGKNGWKSYSFSFNSADNESAIIDFMNSRNTAMKIDNVSIKKVSYIKNGSFEDGWDSWENGGNTIVNTTASNGSKSLYLSTQYIKTHQNVTVSKNTDYKLTFDVYSPNGKGATITVSNVDRSTTIKNETVKGSDGWKTATVEFNSGEFESLRIQFQLGSSAAGVYIDNVILEKAPIVKNGNFENYYNNWTYNSNTITSALASHGSKSACLVKYNHLKQTVTLRKNTNYELRFDLDNTAVGTDSKPGWLQLNLKGADETKLVFVNTDSYGKNGWQTYSFTFNSGDNESAIIDVMNSRDAAMKIDNVVIEMLPIIQNGSFENDFNSWTNEWNNSIDSSIASKGEKSAYLSVQYNRVYQNVAVNKDTYYQLIFDIYSPDKKSAGIKVSDVDRTTTIKNETVKGSDGWETATVVLNSGEFESLRIEFQLSSSAAGVYIDNVKLEQLESITSFESIAGNTLPIEADKEYAYTIAWEYADGSDSGEFKINGRARELGDANNDGSVNVKDLVNMKKGFANLSKDLVYDLSLEGNVDSLDLTIIRQILLGTYTKPEVVYASENGILPDTGNDVSSSLESLLQKKNNAIVVLEEGDYYIGSSVNLSGLENVAVKGYGANFVTKFIPSQPYSYKAGFRFEDCNNFKLYGVSFKTSAPANIKARIVEKRKVILGEDKLVIKIEDGFTFNGNEWIVGIDTLNEDLSTNRHISLVANTGSKYSYEVESENTVAITIPTSHEDKLDNAEIGELLVLKHSLYDTPPMNFYNCKDVLLEDVTVESSAGMACGVYNRSENFTFRRFNVGSETGELACSSNTDGIYIKGLSGKLIMDDCHFYNTGDDALNVHNLVGTIDSVNENSIVAKSFDPLAGDLVYAYDVDTLQRTAEFTVENVTDGETDATKNITFSIVSGSIKAGDKLAIAKLYPTIAINNCSVTNGRGRGFLIQSSNVTVQNCSFTGTSSSGLLLACDVPQWNELGPINNAIIKNNVFDNCGANFDVQAAGGIVIDSSHDNSADKFVDRSTIHSNITITGNTFKNLQDSAIFADAVDGITITDNIMTNCCYGTENERTSDYSKDVVLFNCENIVTENNGNITITNK